MRGVGVFLCTLYFVKIKTIAAFVINKKALWFNFMKTSSDKSWKSSFDYLHQKCDELKGAFVKKKPLESFNFKFLKNNGTC